MSATITNEERSRREVEAFKRDVPSRYFAYHAGPIFRPRGDRVGVGRTITTWTGDLLANVVDVGDVWRSNMGDRRQSFRARAVNGATYSGIAYLDSGDYVRMRRVTS